MERWHLSYIGRPLAPAKSVCCVRPLRVLSIAGPFHAWLIDKHGLSYSLDYEFIQEGFRFEDRDGIEVIVYQVLKIPVSNTISSATSLLSGRWLCEVRSIVAEDQLQAQAQRISSYAQAMAQLVRFSKMMPVDNL